MRSTASIDGRAVAFCGGVTPTCARNSYNIALLQGASRGIASLWLACCGSHIATYISAQQDGCLLVGTLGHIDIHILIGCVLYVRHIEEVLVGFIADGLAVGHRERTWLSAVFVKLQFDGFLRRGSERCNCQQRHDADTFHRRYFHLQFSIIYYPFLMFPCLAGHLDC